VNPFPFIAGGRLGQFFVPKVSFAFVVDPHFRTPYSENYNYGLQYQLTKDTLIEAYYVGSLGRKLITSADVNFPTPGILQQQLTNTGRPADGITNHSYTPPLCRVHQRRLRPRAGGMQRPHRSKLFAYGSRTVIDRPQQRALREP
jgi:hypothetical protein